MGEKTGDGAGKGAAAKAPELKGQESDDELHEDKVVREILALAKMEGVTSYTASTQAFEVGPGSKPSAGQARTIHLRLSALEVLKPFLSDLTISAPATGRDVVHELSTKKGLGRFLRSYRTDHHLPSVLTTLRLEQLTMHFADLRSLLPPSVTTLHFKTCTIIDLNVETTPNGRSFRHVSDSQVLDDQTLTLDVLATDDGNFPALARTLFRTVNSQYEQEADWDEYLHWLASTINDSRNKSKKNQMFKASQLYVIIWRGFMHIGNITARGILPYIIVCCSWNKLLRQQEVAVAMPSSQNGWYSFLVSLDRVAVKDMATMIGGRFRRGRQTKSTLPPKTPTSAEGSTLPPATATVPSTPPTPAASMPPPATPPPPA